MTDSETGDGGGIWSSREGDSAVRSTEFPLSGIVSLLRPEREMLERPLLPDRTEAASPVSPLATMEFLGLSVLPLPGILDRNPRKDRVESLVSDLLKEGYDWRASPEPAPFLEEEPPSLEVWLPIVGWERSESVR